MALRNRVTPLNQIVADPARGLVYGNRGCLHDETGAIRRLYAVRRWIACRLAFKGWERGPLLQPGKFTELFFLDEATAFAAGHRPVRAVPARGLRPLLGDLARRPRRRARRRRHGHAPARRSASRPTAARSAATPRASARCPTALRRP
jgi:hypothetical protein